MYLIIKKSVQRVKEKIWFDSNAKMAGFNYNAGIHDKHRHMFIKKNYDLV